MVRAFKGQYAYLSNFYVVDVEYDGIKYKNSEAAFQAQKVLTEEERMEFADLSPKKARTLGRKVKLREDWNEVKDNVMYEVCMAKFQQHPDLTEKLLSTGDDELVEGNYWNETYWGVCKGEGKNQLGITLMRIREELRSQ